MMREKTSIIRERTRAGMRFAVGAFLMAVVVAGTQPVRGEGALAIGETGSIADDGFAFGLSYDFEDAPAAEARALAECRGATVAAEDVRARCKVVVGFRAQCVALAYDPDEGKPGFGWALGADRAAAEQAALGKCRETAGADRQAFCKVAEQACDGK